MKKVKIIRKFPCGKIEEDFVEIKVSKKSSSKRKPSAKESSQEDADDKNTDN